MTSPGEPDGLTARTANDADVPLEGESSVQMHGWEQVAVDDVDRFAADLRTLGLPEHEVERGAQILHSAEADASEAERAHPSTRDNALTRVKDWLTSKRIVVQTRDPVHVRVPMFVLAADSRPGCAAMINRADGQSRALSWSVTIRGAGLSGDVTITCSLLSSITLEAGQAFLMFLPVTAAVEQVHVAAKDGSTLGSGQRVDLSPVAQHAPAAILFDSRVLPAPGPSLQNYALSGYSGAPVEYQYVYSQQHTYTHQLAAKTATAELSLTCAVSMTTPATLSFTLVGGRDYELCQLTDADGLVWR